MTDKKIPKFAGFLCCLAVMIASCRHTASDDGVPQLIQNRFWNYYLRGAAYSLIGEWDNAARDFEVAMGRMEGALYGEPDEKQRVRTYGLRFLDDYFPHRELGICHYFAGRLDAAERELLLSLDTLPSSRAQFYLNKVRQAQFLNTPDRQADPIRFDIDLPTELQYLNTPHVMLNGTIRSPYHISRVKINGSQPFIAVATDTYTLQQQVSLDTGIQMIRIDASDLAHNHAFWERQLIIDLEGPSVSVSPSPDNPKEELIFTIADNFGVQSLTVDGVNIHLPGKQQPFTQKIPLQPFRSIKVKATDKASNSTLLDANTGDLLKASLDSKQHHPDNRLAHGVAAHNQSQISNFKSQTSDFRLALNLPFQSSAPDTMPPRLWLQPEIGELLVTASSSYTLDITVEDSGMIDSVAYGLNRRQETKSLRKEKCIRYQFNVRLPLELGNNALLVLARDWAENAANKRVKIKRRDTFNLRQDLRMSVAVHVRQPDERELVASFVRDFEEQTEISLAKGYARKLSAMLEQKNAALPAVNATPILEQLLWASRHFNLLERDPETLENLLLEDELRNSRTADIRRMIAAGKLKSAEWILEIYLSPLATGNDNWFLVGKLIDVYTSVVILSVVSDYSGFSADDLAFQLQGFVDKLIQQLPVLEAPILIAGESTASFTLGERDGIVPGRRCVFVRAGEKITAEPLSWNGKWIQGVVESVEANESVVKIYPLDAATALSGGDRAVLR